MKLQASDASAPEGLQSQNLSRPENRLSVNGLAIVHGRLDQQTAHAHVAHLAERDLLRPLHHLGQSTSADRFIAGHVGLLMVASDVS